MKKTALITGITGQDGPYLVKLLLEKDYKIYGLIRRYSTPRLDNLEYLQKTYNINLIDNIELVVGDVTDDSSISQIVRSIRPQEIYNLAAQSFVGVSWDLNKLTTEVNAIGPLNILNAIKTWSPHTRLYQASTSEMFGNAKTSIQSEDTPFKPRSPYGIAKLYGHWITVNYRDSYGIHASSGILFNHESPIRGKEFVTRKISTGVAAIKLGLQKHIRLGNLDARRDWGYAEDYVTAMWSMLQQEKPDDYVIATGNLYSVKDFLSTAFDYVGLGTDWESHVIVDQRFVRPAELYQLCGNADKAKNILGWKPRTNFKDLVHLMVQEDLKRIEKFGI